jgi:molybdate transport system substrate-binding protein
VVQIRVLSAGAVQPMVESLGAEFERESGHKLDVQFGTAGAVRDRLKAGEKADLAILSAAAIDALEKLGLFVSGSRTDVGRTVTGLAVPEGAALPDISTVDAFKRALLAARTVSYTDPKAGGSSGNFFVALLERLGIADAVNAKAVLRGRGYEVAEAVANGDADIGTTFVSEILTVKGARLVGPLPDEIANVNTYTGAVLAGSTEREAAAAFLRKLVDPATRGRWTAAGLEPAFQA